MSYNSLITTAVNYWAMQETSGNSLADTAPPNAGTGALVNRQSTTASSVVTASGPNGWLASAVRILSSNNGNLRTTARYADNWPQQFTIGGWMKVDSTTAQPQNLYGRMFSISAMSNFGGGTVGNEGRGIYIGGYSEGVTKCQLPSGSEIATTNWTHIVRAYHHPNKQGKGWKNGTATGTANVSAPVWAASTSGSLIGAFSNGGNDNTSTGNYAGWFLFDRVLTDGEVAELYNGPEPINLTRPSISVTQTAIYSVETLTCEHLPTLDILDAADMPVAGPTTYVRRLRVTPGTWDAQNNGAVTHAYEWIRDGVVVGGYSADPTVYKFNNPADINSRFILRETASNNGGSHLPACSLPYPKSYRGVNDLQFWELGLLGVPDVDFLVVESPTLAATPEIGFLTSGELLPANFVIYAGASPELAWLFGIETSQEIGLSAQVTRGFVWTGAAANAKALVSWPEINWFLSAAGQLLGAPILQATSSIDFMLEADGVVSNPVYVAADVRRTFFLEGEGGTISPITLQAAPELGFLMEGEASTFYLLQSTATVPFTLIGDGNLDGLPLDFTGNGVSLLELGFGAELR